MFRELMNDLQGRFLVYLPTLLTEVFLFPLNRAQFSSSFQCNTNTQHSSKVPGEIH